MSEARAMILMPPPPDCCQVCAVQHAPEYPHDPESLYYQVVFQREYGRSATWEDAMAHCTPEMQAIWREELAADERI